MNLLSKAKLSSLIIGLCCCLVTSFVYASQPVVSPRSSLEHIIEAEKMQSFSGVFIYEKPNYSEEAYIHQQVSENGQTIRWVKKDKGKEGFLRVNGEIQCVTKGYGNKFRINNILQSIKKTELDTLFTDYDIKILPDIKKIGERSAHELVFKGKDNDRYIYKLAFDDETSFPLQFVFLDNHNNTLESGKFREFYPKSKNEVEIEPLDDCMNVVHQKKNDHSNWMVDWIPSGFDLEGVINKSDLQDEHLIFSDGLVSFSIFIEPVFDSELVDFKRALGATTVVSKKIMTDNKQYLVTIVGEIPETTAQRIISSVNHK